MENLISIGVRSIFIDNMIFAYFLGMCSYLAVSKKVSTAFGLGLAVIFVLGFTIPINWLIQNHILNQGSLAWISPELANIDLTFLQFIVFIAVIASMVQLTEMAIEKFSPALYGSLGIFLPLIAVNCAILGGALFMVGRSYTLGEATVFGIGSGYCSAGRFSRENEIFQCARSAPRPGDHVHTCRIDVPRLSELHGILAVSDRSRNKEITDGFFPEWKKPSLFSEHFNVYLSAQSVSAGLTRNP